MATSSAPSFRWQFYERFMTPVRQRKLLFQAFSPEAPAVGRGRICSTTPAQAELHCPPPPLQKKPQFKKAQFICLIFTIMERDFRDFYFSLLFYTSICKRIVLLKLKYIIFMLKYFLLHCFNQWREFGGRVISFLTNGSLGGVFWKPVWNYFFLLLFFFQKGT